MLQIVAVTDPLKLGLPVMAMVGVAVDGDIRAVADVIGTIPEVIYVVITAGAYDMFVEVVCPDTDTLFGVVNDHIKSIDGVRAAESFVYFDIHTHRFNLGCSRVVKVTPGIHDNDGYGWAGWPNDQSGWWVRCGREPWLRFAVS